MKKRAELVGTAGEQKGKEGAEDSFSELKSNKNSQRNLVSATSDDTLKEILRKIKTSKFPAVINYGASCYGVILEKLQNKNSELIGRIKGCIVDSAPVAALDPQVWASGFSAAFLKKNSVATKGSFDEPNTEALAGSRTSVEVKLALTEAALLLVLESSLEWF